MNEQDNSAIIAHAKRDRDQGKPWRCVCPLCISARQNSELVSQIQTELGKSSASVKKPQKETAS